MSKEPEGMAMAIRNADEWSEMTRPAQSAGEWTVDKENKELIAPTGERFSVGFASMDSEPLAKLINAALAAERERWDEQFTATMTKLGEYMQDNKQLRMQLDGEGK